ncbi:hypothetical protein EDC14_1003253 [Hydrogenispora ethanolica]|jgi:hypothetical protein|uniref:Uncharacterized protein n=1 Tax=Hydrogenispora ethanolica TaxID=1082276 RepID=A0A4R1S7S7_HYDET|nr:hypothetical protein EDC14_1003253 [Hydrogenispora ethanolica]
MPKYIRFPKVWVNERSSPMPHVSIGNPFSTVDSEFHAKKEVFYIHAFLFTTRSSTPG